MSKDTVAGTVEQVAPTSRPPRWRPGAGPLRELVRALARPGPLVVLVLSAAYAVTVRRDVGRLAADQGGVLDGWAVLLSCLADPYSTIWVLLPVAAVQACGHVTHRYDHAALIRRGSWARWLAATTRSAQAPIAALLLAWLAAGLLATAGLPWHGGWRPAWQPSAARDLGTAQLLPYLAGSGLAPPVLLAAQLVLLAAALLAGHTLLGAVVVATRETGHVPLLVAVAAVAGALGVLVGFHLSGVLPWWANPSQLLLLTPALHLPAGPWSAIAIWLGLSGLVWAVVHQHAALIPTLGIVGRAAGRLLGVVPGPVLAYAVLCLAGMVAVRSWGASWLTGDTWDTAALTLYGSSPDGAAGVLWLYSSIVVIGYGYLVVLHLHAALGPHAAYAMLRHGSPLRWAWRTIAPALAMAPLVLAALVGVALLLQLDAQTSATAATGGTAATSPDTASSLVPGAGAGALLFQLLVNGWLQITVVVLAILLTALATRDRDRPLWPTAVLGAFLVAAAPGLADIALLPAGLNGAGQATGGWPVVLRHSTVLLAWTAALALGAHVLLRRLTPRWIDPDTSAPTTSPTGSSVPSTSSEGAS